MHKKKLVHQHKFLVMPCSFGSQPRGLHHTEKASRSGWNFVEFAPNSFGDGSFLEISSQITTKPRWFSWTVMIFMVFLLAHTLGIHSEIDTFKRSWNTHRMSIEYERICYALVSRRALHFEFNWIEMGHIGQNIMVIHYIMMQLHRKYCKTIHKSQW